MKFTHVRFPAILLSVLFFLNCATAVPVQRGNVSGKNLRDGLFTANYREGLVKAVVEVETGGGKIKNIRILKHSNLRGGEAEEIIPGRILESQSTDVDAVSGATASSNVIMSAVQLAVNKAVSEDK